RPHSQGGKGCTELAEAVLEAAEEPSTFKFLYPDDMPLRRKIEEIAERVYGAEGGVAYSVTASRQLAEMERLGYGGFPLCVAKTNLSLSADPMLTGAPSDWMLPVREVRAAAGAGFIVPICGDIRLMPGLGSAPALERIDLDEEGNIVGLS
ncbi:MAG TPA: formate--tetrahydrofolate ligase, partial [Acidimicrobiia bacterium]